MATPPSSLATWRRLSDFSRIFRIFGILGKRVVLKQAPPLFKGFLRLHSRSPNLWRRLDTAPSRHVAKAFHQLRPSLQSQPVEVRPVKKTTTVGQLPVCAPTRPCIHGGCERATPHHPLHGDPSGRLPPALVCCVSSPSSLLSGAGM